MSRRVSSLCPCSGELSGSFIGSCCRHLGGVREIWVSMKIIRSTTLFFVTLSLAALLSASARAQDGDFFLYVGTYTGFKYVHHSRTYGVGESHSKGIYV